MVTPAGTALIPVGEVVAGDKFLQPDNSVRQCVSNTPAAPDPWDNEPHYDLASLEPNGEPHEEHIAGSVKIPVIMDTREPG